MSRATQPERRLRNGLAVGGSAQEEPAPIEPPLAVIDAEPKPLGQEAPQIVADASRIGARRLHRSILGTAITAFIGGMSVSFGAVAMAWAGASLGGAPAPSPAHLAASLAFPVGFVILLLGKSELFTENFLLPVMGLLERRGSAPQLAQLWSVTLAANLIGAAVFALLISRSGVLDSAPADELRQIAMHKLAYPLETAFIKAIFAGWLMTVMTWLLLAADSLGPRLVLIWLIGTLIVLGQFNHVVISASEIFIAMALGTPIGPADWLSRNVFPALLGNVLGGVVFVTLLHYVQAQYEDRDGTRRPV